MPRSARPAVPVRPAGAVRRTPAAEAAAAARPDPPPPGQPAAESGSVQRRRLWPLLRAGVIAAVWGGLALALVVLWFARDLPRPEDALAPSRRPSLFLRDDTGHVFARFGDVQGRLVHLSDLPPYVTAAVVDTEDRRFWSEPGIDPIGILRAALVDLLHWRVVQGGSTLTQQVAKTLFLSDARTFGRKVRELLLTAWLDRHFTKRQILEIWLNRVYFGSGAWGIDAAARVYFGVPAARLTLWQAAVLAGLPRAPSRFNPRADPLAAAARARAVLAAMVRANDLTPAAAQAAADAIAFPRLAPMAAGWFADWTAGQAAPLLSPGRDAVLDTTLDPRLQRAAEAALAAVLDGPGAARGVGQGAVVVLDAASGAVRALVGGRDYQDSSYDRATEARRQPGSTFKPFVWLAALERGVRPDDRVPDAPIRLGGWAPQDDGRRYLGAVTVRRALALSLNTVAVRLLLRAGGPRAVAAVAHRLGIADRLPDNASIALGTANVGLLELAAAYAPFFNGGKLVVPFGIDGIAAGGVGHDSAGGVGHDSAGGVGHDSAGGVGHDSAGGMVRALAPPPPRQVVAPALAAMMAQMLGAVVKSGTGAAAAVPGMAVAGKTGTTQDFRDAWFVGCADGRIIGVWLGNDDDRPMRGVDGGSLPAAVFHRIALTLRAAPAG